MKKKQRDYKAIANLEGRNLHGLLWIFGPHLLYSLSVFVSSDDLFNQYFFIKSINEKKEGKRKGEGQ